MSFRGLFSKSKKEKKPKTKPLPSAQEMYERASHYSEKFSQLAALTDGEYRNKLAVDFLKELHNDTTAVNCRSAIRDKFEKAYCAENIDFLFNYFDMTPTLAKEQWNAFYHQYVVEDEKNKSIKFTEININAGDRVLFSQLNDKILNGEKDLDRVALKGDKAYTGRTFLEHMSIELAGYILGRNDLVVTALTELQQKALTAGAVPTKEIKEEKESPKNRRESKESSKEKAPSKEKTPDSPTKRF